MAQSSAVTVFAADCFTSNTLRDDGPRVLAALVLCHGLGGRPGMLECSVVSGVGPASQEEEGRLLESGQRHSCMRAARLSGTRTGRLLGTAVKGLLLPGSHRGLLPTSRANWLRSRFGRWTTLGLS